MNSVKDFFDSLSESHRDIFLAMLSDMQSTAPEEKLERLRNFQAQLKTEIDAINMRRQGLGGVLNNAETVLKFVNDYVRIKGDSLDTALLRGFIEKIIADLKSEIAATKPEKKLEKKFDVARRIESLEQRRNISTQLFSMLLNKGDIRTLLDKGSKYNFLKDLDTETEDA